MNFVHCKPRLSCSICRNSSPVSLKEWFVARAWMCTVHPHILRLSCIGLCVRACEQVVLGASTTCTCQRLNCCGTHGWRFPNRFEYGPVSTEVHASPNPTSPQYQFLPQGQMHIANPASMEPSTGLKSTNERFSGARRHTHDGSVEGYGPPPSLYSG